MSDVVLLRTLTLKSYLGFGKWPDLSIRNILDCKGIAANKYLVWLYYRASRISFNEEILKRLGIYDKIKINKPGKISEKELLKKFQRFDKKIQIKYPVFKNLREKGYIVKTALKFGADFRVYDKGAKSEKKHAKWIVFVDHESKKLTWHEFSAKNRVAHSTKKNLLLAIVDEESDITYYEVSWLKL